MNAAEWTRLEAIADSKDLAYWIWLVSVLRRDATALDRRTALLRRCKSVLDGDYVGAPSEAKGKVVLDAVNVELAEDKP